MPPRVDMPDLRMHQPVNRHTVDQDATADSGADGEVHEGVDVSRRPPAMLGQGGRVDVGIETDRAGEFPRESARNIGAAPSRLRRLADETVLSGGLVELHRTERADADCRERAERLTPLPQESVRGRERRGRIGSGEALVREDFAAVVADGNDKLGASGFNTSKIEHHSPTGTEAYPLPGAHLNLAITTRDPH